MSFNRTATGTLARETLIKMAVRLAIVIVASTAIGYSHIYSALESQAREQLEKYVLERGQRERSLFALAQDNLAKLKQELLRQLKEPEKQDPQAEFNQLFVKQKDGVTRNRPESFDHTRQAGVFIDDQVTITADVRRLVLTFYNLANAYGPAWDNRFPNTYFMTPENFSVGYWPGFNFIQEVTADTYEPGEEYFWVADKVHNPQRKTVWTGLYYDRVAKLWTVSCVAPIDVGNRHVASVGHDVPLNELIKRTVNGQLKGTYNIIFRKDGRLIAHPKLIKQLQASEGKFDILKSGDEHLKSIFQQVTEMKPGEVVIDSTEDGEYLAVTTIPGPDWYFVVVFPKSILSAQAFKTARFILILGIVSLLVELLVLFFVLRNQIAAPLKQFIKATKQLAEGNLNVKLDATRQDELGHLADSFNSMAHALGERDVQLVDQNRLLGQSEKRFRALVQNASDVILILEADRTICYASASLHRILAYLSEDWVGTDLLQWIHPNDAPQIQSFLAVCLHNPQVIPSINLQLQHRQSHWCWVEAIINNRLSDLSVSGIVINFRDITERMRVEEVLQQAHDQLEHRVIERTAELSQANEQLHFAEEEIRGALEKEQELGELKSRFVSMTSHEFRTPLTTILSSAELLEIYSHKWSEDKKLTHFQRIQVAVKQMTGLLNDVLLIGKAEAGKLELKPTGLNLAQFCGDLVEEIQLSAAHATNGCPAPAIAFVSQGQCTDVWLDEKLLRHILSNLLSNAVKYSPQGGTVHFDLICNSEEVTLQVRDEGIGIPVADQAQLFNSFHRASNVGAIAGTGLGLAIVKKSVDLHRGRIAVESEVGVGTTFTVTIPLNH